MISKMASVIITLKIMPESPDTDVQELESIIKKKIGKHTGNKEFRINIEEIAFGLKALNITFIMDESKGSTEKLEREISDIEGVNSVNVVDVRRAFG